MLMAAGERIEGEVKTGGGFSLEFKIAIGKWHSTYRKLIARWQIISMFVFYMLLKISRL